MFRSRWSMRFLASSLPRRNPFLHCRSTGSHLSTRMMAPTQDPRGGLRTGQPCRCESLHRQAETDCRIFTAREQEHRSLGLSNRLTDDVDRFCLEMGEVRCLVTHGEGCNPPDGRDGSSTPEDPYNALNGKPHTQPRMTARIGVGQDSVEVDSPRPATTTCQQPKALLIAQHTSLIVFSSTTPTRE